MSTPFVLNGLPRSGSTWLQRMLDAHPRIRCLTEHKMTELGSRLKAAVDGYLADRDAGITSLLKQSTEGEPFPPLLHHDLVVTAMTHILAEMRRADTAGTLLAHGFKDNLVNPLFLLDRTDARVVLLVRDPRDIVVAAWRGSLGHGGALERAHGTIEAYAEAYIEYWLKSMRDRRRALATAPDRCHLVTYEALHADGAAVFSGVCRALGVPVVEAEIAAAVEAASFQRVTGARQGEEDLSRHARKGIVGDWRNHLLEDVAARMVERARSEPELLRFFVDVDETD
jgi:hypothetical protein